ncbi:MAG: hypothetical protein WD266_10095 [Balneolales bacterium]
MIAKAKNTTRPKPASLQRIDQPFYGLKSYHPEAGRSSYATRKKSSSGIKIAPWKIILTTLIIGVAGYIYLSHIFQTQEILREVTELRRTHETVRRSHAEQSLAYDRMTGPAQIYRQAGSLGFVHGAAADPIIRIPE